MCRVAACAVFAAVTACPVYVSADSTPAPSAPNSVATESAQTILAQFAASAAKITAYTADVSVFERKGTQRQNVVFNYSFHQPSTVAVHVAAGPNAGVTMTWDGGTTVVAHRGSGFAALFKKTFPLHDPLTTTIRGSSIDQLSFPAILAHAQQEAGTLTEATHADTGGIGIDALTLMSANPAANDGLTREIVELSATTHLPVQVLGYDDNTLVRQIDFSNVSIRE